MNRIRPAVKFTFCPGHKRPTHPMLRRSGCCLQRLSAPLFASSFSPSWTRSEILEGGETSHHFRADSPVQQYFSPLKSLVVQPACVAFFVRAFPPRTTPAEVRTGTESPPVCGSARFCRAEKCRRKPGAQRYEGSGIFQDWRPPPAPRPAHHRGPRSPPAPPHGRGWNCSWRRS